MLSVKVLGSELYDNDPGSIVLVPTWPGEWKRVQGPRLLAPAYSVSGTIDELEPFLDEWRGTSPESNVHMHLFRCHRSSDSFAPCEKCGATTAQECIANAKSL